MSIRHPLYRAFAPSLLTVLVLAACGSDRAEALLASAKEYMDRNDHRAAVIQIKNALQKDGDMPEARYLLGKAFLNSGDPISAEVELRKAAALAFSPELVTPMLARTMLAAGKFNKVIEEFGQAQMATPESSADLQTTLAGAYTALGNASAARAALAAALAAQPDFAPARLFQARMRAADRDFPGALAAVESILSKSSREPEAWKLKGDILQAQGEADQALAAYAKALEFRPDFVSAHSSVISIHVQRGKLDEAGKQVEALKKVAPQHPETLFQEARLAYQKKDYVRARELSQQFLRRAPDSPLGLQLAGAVEYHLNSSAQAEAYLTRALQHSPELGLARRLLAMNYLRSGQAGKALTALKPILDDIEHDADTLSLVGQVYVQMGEPQKAEEYFAKAVTIAPDDAAKKTALAMTHLLKGRPEAAFDELERIAASDSGVTADLALFVSHMRRNEFDKALKAADALQKKQPKNPLAHNLRGRVLIAKRDTAGARKSFERALAVSPANFPAATSLAALDLADKKPDDAKRRFKSVLAADPKNVQALLALAGLEARTGGKVESAAALVAKAVSANPNASAPRIAMVDLYLRSKEFKKALSAAQDAVAALPDRPELVEALGRAHLASGDTNQALAAFGQLALLQPTSPKPHLQMAMIHAMKKDKTAALQSLRKSLEIKPDLVEAQRGLVDLYLDARSTNEALAVAQQVQKQRPKEAVGFVLEGDVRAASQSWASAIAAYRQGLAKSPTAEVAVKLHSALAARAEHGDAEKFATTWLADRPQDAVFRQYLADRASTRGDYAAAVQHYRVLLGRQPNNPVLLNNLAWAMGKQKGPQAIEYAEKANKLAPNQPAFMDTLAVLLADKGELKRAVELLRQAVTLAPQAATIRLSFAKMLIREGSKADARKELETLAKLGDRFPEHSEVEKLMKEL